MLYARLFNHGKYENHGTKNQIPGILSVSWLLFKTELRVCLKIHSGIPVRNNC